jgi:YVTN family beta-propeller protein
VTVLVSVVAPAPAATGAVQRVVAYVANFGSDTVSVVDVASNTVTDTIPVGNDPRGIDIGAIP